jgi:CHAD domain-containing protein
MPPLTKWIEGLSADADVRAAARQSLEDRLSAVHFWLPIAARHLAHDGEPVHQLRVSTRRASAALKLYGDWLPRDPYRWLTRRLHKIRNAANMARDLDVLSHRLRDMVDDEVAEPLPIVGEKRRAIQPKIVAIARKCAQRNCFVKQTDRLLERVRPRGRNAKSQNDSFPAFAAERLQIASVKFFTTMPADINDLAALHQFRIRGKKLRYTIELLAPAFDATLRDIHYPTIEELQEHLGRINDCVAGDAQLQAWRHTANSPQQEQVFYKLIEQHRLELHAAIREYCEWWTPEQAEALRKGLDDVARDVRSQPTAAAGAHEKRSNSNSGSTVAQA